MMCTNAAGGLRAVCRFVYRTMSWTPLLAVALAARCEAFEYPLFGGRTVRFHAGDRPEATVIFSGDAALAKVADPRCPAESSVRIVSSADDVKEIALDCHKWRQSAHGYRYLDPSGSAGGVTRIVLAGTRLSISLRRDFPADAAPRFVEAALTVGADSYCGRFATPARQFADARAVRGPSQACRLPRPNLIVVVLDDVRADGVDRMPMLLNRIAAEGVSFDNAFTPNASCAPSRASILTGLYALRHRTTQVAGRLGGAHRFREFKADRQTIPVWLQKAGYRTGLFGKYLNAYSETEQKQGPDGTFYIPPGWDRWWAFVSPEHYGGVHGTSYRVIEEGGKVSSYEDHSTDAQYSTDVSAQRMREFINDSVQRGQPFFAYWAPYAGHAETPDMIPAPADRHAGTFNDLDKWRPESWDEADVSDKPRWVQMIQSRMAKNWEAKLSRFVTETNRREQYESLLAADEQIGLVLDELQELGIDQDTLILVISDNGLGWGEHQLWGEKGCPYEECQRVPFMVRYPRRVAPGRRVAGSALNIDIAPTFAAVGDASVPLAVDGRDLSGWLVGPPPVSWRPDYLLEHWRLEQGDSLTYKGQVADGDRIRVFFDGTLRQPRPAMVFEFDAGDGTAPGTIAVPIGKNADATFANFADIVGQRIPGVKAGVDKTRGMVSIARPSPNEYWSVYLWEEVDQNQAFETITPLPNYVGVRDVDGGFTWVEYETGERELYDLKADPQELVNRADDPAYAATRARLENRLKDMLKEIKSR
jgi:arylsulfatase A-like enzyme